MALVKCRECGKEISNTAKTCPHCGAKISRGIGCVSVVLFSVGIIIVILYIIMAVAGKDGNNDGVMGGSESESNVSILSRIRAEGNNIKFEVLRCWDIPNNGYGMEILVDEKANKEDILRLAGDIRSNYIDKTILSVSIFDSREACRNRLNENYPEGEYFKHYLVELGRNQNSGYDEIQWTARDRDH